MRSATAFIVILLMLHTTGCNKSKDDATTQQGDSQNRLAEIRDIGIASFLMPSGWRPNRSDGNTVLILIRSDGDRTAPSELISIDVGKATYDDASETASKLALKFGGTASQLSYKLDGEVAFKVSIPPNYQKVMPRECIVVHHQDQACFLFGASKTKTDIWPVVDGIGQSWKWK